MKSQHLVKKMKDAIIIIALNWCKYVFYPNNILGLGTL